MTARRAASTLAAPPRAASKPGLPSPVIALAKAHGLNPAKLLGWVLHADGSAVILAPDGKKYRG